MEHTSSEKIVDALKLLEEAALQKRDELKSVMSNKYTHLKGVIVETETSLVKSLAEAGKHAGEAAVHAKEVSIAKTAEISRDVDKSVHSNPWPYIAGSAVVGLLLGAVLVRSSK